MSVRQSISLTALSILMGSTASVAAVMPLEKPCMAVKVEAGQYAVSARTVSVPTTVMLTIEGCDRIQVKNEEHVLTDEQPNGMFGGALLTNTNVPPDPTRLPGAIVPESVKVHTRDGVTVYQEDKDYHLDHFWGGLCRLVTGSISKEQKVYVDYEVFLQRVDSVQVSNTGRVFVKKGKSALICPEIPIAENRCTTIANIFVPFRTDAITSDLIYPLPSDNLKWRSFVKTSGREYLSNTLSILKEGKPLSIACWGDSITQSASASPKEKCYVDQLQIRLKAAYPKAQINLINAGIGGSNTNTRKEGFEKEVLSHNPDLITVEFVNDIGLGSEVIRKNWVEFIARARAKNPKVEFIAITPSYMWPEWNANYEKCIDEMRQTAQEHRIALADTGNIWANLRTIGVPYTTLLPNMINHPNNLGHEFFVETIMNLLTP